MGKMKILVIAFALLLSASAFAQAGKVYISSVSGVPDTLYTDEAATVKVTLVNISQPPRVNAVVDVGIYNIETGAMKIVYNGSSTADTFNAQFQIIYPDPDLSPGKNKLIVKVTYTEAGKIVLSDFSEKYFFVGETQKTVAVPETNFLLVALTALIAFRVVVKSSWNK